MALIVQKYGGSSVADTESIKRVAKRVVETEKKGNKVAVVVSAMGDTTDDLIDQALSIDSNPPEREMDMLMTAGERISMSLLAMAIHAEGSRAHSFTGQQAGFFQVQLYGFGAWGQRGFNPRLAHQAARVGVARQQGGGDHVTRIAGVGAARDGRDDDCTVRHLAGHVFPLRRDSARSQVGGRQTLVRV